MARRVTLLVLLVLLAAPAFADVDGFRGMRWGERLDEVARMVLWLSSDDCSFSTGGIFDLSGGRASY